MEKSKMTGTILIAVDLAEPIDPTGNSEAPKSIESFSGLKEKSDGHDLPEAVHCTEEAGLEDHSQPHLMAPADDGTFDELSPSLGGFFLIFTCIIVGLIFWVGAVVAVLFAGWSTLPMLAVYFAVANAVILGAAVVFALLSSETYDLD